MTGWPVSQNGSYYLGRLLEIHTPWFCLQTDLNSIGLKWGSKSTVLTNSPNDSDKGLTLGPHFEVCRDNGFYVKIIDQTLLWETMILINPSIKKLFTQASSFYSLLLSGCFHMWISLIFWDQTICKFECLPTVESLSCVIIKARLKGLSRSGFSPVSE